MMAMVFITKKKFLPSQRPVAKIKMINHD